MKRYILADLCRLSKRVPRWVLVGLCWLLSIVIIAIFVSTSKTPTTGSDFISQAKNAIALSSVFFGLFEIVYIYGDDFKAKSMQIAIGSGISRRRIVNSKWVITMITVAFDLFAMVFLLVIEGLIISEGLSIKSVGELLLYTIALWVSIISTVGVVAILIFACQGIGLAVLLYLAIQFTGISKVIDILSVVCKIERFHLSSYELSSLYDVFTARLELGSIHFSSLVGIIIYMVVSFLLAELIFRHRELDF